MTHGDVKDLPRRAASDKILCVKAFNISKNPKCDEYQKGLVSIVFDKNSSTRCKETVINSDVVSGNQQSAEELHEPMIRKFEKQQLH